MKEELNMNTGEILIYQNQEGNIKIEVQLDEETVWLTQAQLCDLFKKSKGKSKTSSSVKLSLIYKQSIKFF